MNETRTLAQFVADTRFADLPVSLVASCKIAVLDALGSGFVGSIQPWTRRILSVIRPSAERPRRRSFTSRGARTSGAPPSRTVS